MVTQFNILAWRIPKDRGAWRDTVPSVAKSRTILSISTNIFWLPNWLIVKFSILKIQTMWSLFPKEHMTPSLVTIFPQSKMRLNFLIAFKIFWERNLSSKKIPRKKNIKVFALTSCHLRLCGGVQAVRLDQFVWDRGPRLVLLFSTGDLVRLSAWR